LQRHLDAVTIRLIQDEFAVTLECVGGAIESTWGGWVGNLLDAYDDIHASIVTDA
jgi:hypothetical protein